MTPLLICPLLIRRTADYRCGSCLVCSILTIFYSGDNCTAHPYWGMTLTTAGFSPPITSRRWMNPRQRRSARECNPLISVMRRIQSRRFRPKARHQHTIAYLVLALAGGLVLGLSIVHRRRNVCYVIRSQHLEDGSSCLRQIISTNRPHVASRWRVFHICLCGKAFTPEVQYSQTPPNRMHQFLLTSKSNGSSNAHREVISPHSGH